MMMDWYYEQLEQTHPITWEELENLNVKTYNSGREIRVGDTVLIGVMKNSSTTVSMVKFHKDELNTVYKVVDSPNYNDYGYPLLKMLV
jgi:hypothetical protein